MSEPILKYPTVCQMTKKDGKTPCGFTVVDYALNVEIIGRPDARVQAFIDALMQHVKDAHPQALKLAMGRSQLYIAYLTIGIFKSEDPAIENTRKQMEEQFRRDITPHAVTDDEIEGVLGHIGFTMEDPHRAQVKHALQHLRNYYEGAIPKQALEDAKDRIIHP